MRPQVKVCCISSHQEAELALKYGASAVGLVGPMPNGPGIISLDLIASISRQFSQKVETFYLTSKTSAKDILAEYHQALTTTIQLVDDVPISEIGRLRKHLPSQLKLIQVLHVRSESIIQEAKRKQALVDGFLLDSGNPKAAVKTLGGTGQTHNWDISKSLVDAIDKPVYLAGGINSENVISAFEKVRPYGIDLCSGLRTNGKLDENKLKNFFEKINNI